MTSIEGQADRKMVTFSLGTQMFGINMMDLIEIREWEAPTPLPNVPSYIKGVTNLRGTVIPVIGLAERLGWTPSVIHPRSCILVVNIDGKQSGLLVDEVADIVTLVDSEVQPAPESEVGDTNVIAGVVRIGAPRGKDGEMVEGEGTMVLLLDLTALAVSRPQEMAA
jgi:purine-binding chemotaxis protein CheW